MILFCEECGQRNSITLTPALIETNSFSCQFCGFRSPFPFLDKDRNSTSASTVISWQPEVLNVSAEGESNESHFQLTFALGDIQQPELTLEPFRQFARLITVIKKATDVFSVTVKPLGNEKGIPAGSSIPVMIFCEENIMTWGTIKLSRETKEKLVGNTKKKAQISSELREDSKKSEERTLPPSPSENQIASAARQTAIVPATEPQTADVEILHRQLQEYRAQIHQTKTAAFRMQKELSMRRQVMDSQNCGLLFVGTDQQILYANPAVLRRCGCTLKAMQDRRLDQVLAPSNPSQTLESVLNEAQEKGAWDGMAILLDAEEEQKEPFAASLAYSSEDEGGRERGFICLLYPPAWVHSEANPMLKTMDGSSGMTPYVELGHDPLTGLADRPSFQQYLEDSLLLAAGEEATGIGLLYIDLDHFKRINRIFGPGFGDKVLCSVAAILQKCAKEEGADLVARLSGDEFAIVLPPPSDRERARKLAEKIMQRFRTPLENESRAILIRPSIGFSIYPEDGNTPLELLRNADAAMEAAKGEGGNRICQWNSGMRIQAAESLYLENDLRQAVMDDQLINFYQPQIDLNNGSICGMEALARWIHPVKGMISPAAFIPIAESTGLIEKLGIDLVRKACIQGKKWRDMGFTKFVMAVNLSGRLLRQNLFHQIMSCIETSGYPPDALEVEFTEGVLIENMEFTVDLINRLRAEGVKMAIDDFGTGYSSLSYLQHLKVDKIKIDRSFITNVTTNKTDAAITLGIISIAKNLGFKVIAEGIETEDHLFFLQKSRCDEGQGYLFSTPISEKDMSNLLLRDSSVALNHKRMMDKFYSIQARDRKMKIKL